MSYLFDTCTVSDLIRGTGRTGEHFNAASQASMHISSISVMEFHYGMELSPQSATRIHKPLMNILDRMTIIDYTADMAKTTAQIRAALKNKGTPVGPYDLLIAATAVAHGLTLVTSNDRELSRIPGLKLENWRA